MAEIPHDFNKMSVWPKRYIELAAHVAQWSKDHEKKVGAVVTDDEGRNIAFGYNGPPPKVHDSVILNREDKNRYVIHAEHNALMNAHFDLQFGILYTTKPLCVGCACAVLTYGIDAVYMPEIEATSKWYREQSDAFDLLREHVHVRFYRGGPGQEG